MCRRFLVFCFIFALALAPVLIEKVHAQTPGIGAIRGRILDEAGVPVPGAEVTVTNAATGFSRSTRSDAQGGYVLPELPLTGDYSLRVAHEGFADQEKSGIELRAGETAAIDAVVQVQAVAAAITVCGTADGVRTDSPQLGTRFDNEKIQETPLLGRKLTALPLLNSSVRPARGTGDLFLNNTLFVIDGGGRRQTTYTVDGGTADDAWGRQTIFTNVPLAAIQELTVLTNAFSAEYGRTTGAAINIVTRSGTNEFHGDLVGVSRPGGLQADAPVTGQKARDELKQGSGFLSGPIVHDRAYLAARRRVQRPGPRLGHHLGAGARRLHRPLQADASLRPPRRRSQPGQTTCSAASTWTASRTPTRRRGRRRRAAERGADLPP